MASMTPRFILTGSLKACAAWAADRDLHLSEWRYVEPRGTLVGIGHPTRVYALVEDESQLPPVVDWKGDPVVTPPDNDEKTPT